MNRHQRRAAAAGHVGRANGHAAPQVSPRGPQQIPWCLHPALTTRPAYAPGAAVIVKQHPVPFLVGARAVVVVSAQRLCRLLGPHLFAAVSQRSPEAVAQIHDLPCYQIEHLVLADGGSLENGDQRLALPFWATESWLEEPSPILVTGIR